MENAREDNGDWIEEDFIEGISLLKKAANQGACQFFALLLPEILLLQETNSTSTISLRQFMRQGKDMCPRPPETIIL